MPSPRQRPLTPSNLEESVREHVRSRNIKSACQGRIQRTLNTTPNLTLTAPYEKSRNFRYAATSVDLKNRLLEINRGYTVSCLEIAANQNPPFKPSPGPIPAPLSATECKILQIQKRKVAETPTPSIKTETQQADSRTIRVSSLLESRQSQLPNPLRGQHTQANVKDKV